MALRNIYECIRELFPAKLKWSAKEVPDLTGKVLLITGANTGIGLETARVLLEKNGRVYIACRSPSKAKAALEDLHSSTGKGHNLSILSLDLSYLPSIKAAVDDFLRSETRLDALLNNAGIAGPSWDKVTPHGHDLQFGTNVLGHFYLTQLLLPTLLATAKISPEKHARVVSLSSNLHWAAPTESRGGPILYETLVDSPTRPKGNKSLQAYNQSKATRLCTFSRSGALKGDVLFSNALARKYGDQGIVSSAQNPGAIRTQMQDNWSSFTRWLMTATVLYPTTFGALGPLYAATSPEGAELNGKYLVPWTTLKYTRDDMNSVEHQEALWAWCESEVKKFAPV